MISVDEAKNIVRSNSKPLHPVMLDLSQAAGLVLAEAVYTLTDAPPFHQAAMDGYAFVFNDYQQGKTVHVTKEVPAGDSTVIHLKAGEAARIFTGAPVPQGADTVVMQEKVSIENDELIINDAQLAKGSNVRLRGSEIQRGARALPEKTYLTPAAIGFLAGIGVHKVPVYSKPQIRIIVTGNELQRPGQPLQPGQVYESNSFALNAALQQLQISDVQTFFVNDAVENLEKVLSNALVNSDVVLLTGGVSVGDYDFVVQAATACGVTQLFHKVAQKPGKPLFFGKKESKLVFGLPGNPASVLTCFYQYVVPALEEIMCRRGLQKNLQLPLGAAYTKKEGLTHFLKGWYDGNNAMPLPAQESYKMASFATANCLITLSEAKAEYKEGDLVEVLLLPS